MVIRVKVFSESFVSSVFQPFLCTNYRIIDHEWSLMFSACMVEFYNPTEARSSLSLLYCCPLPSSQRSLVLHWGHGGRPTLSLPTGRGLSYSVHQLISDRAFFLLALKGRGWVRVFLCALLGAPATFVNSSKNKRKSKALCSPWGIKNNKFVLF